jgi:hypothetical protein
MPIVKGLLVSGGERRTHQILEKYAGHFKVFTKVRFFDVIEWDSPNISPGEHRYLEKTHFDFVISQPQEPLKPLFAVEFDGIGDDAPNIDPYRNLKKETKSKVCDTEGFPLLWLEFQEIKEIDGETMLDSILEHYIGGEWVEELIAKGELSPDDAYASVFPPTASLLSKYNIYFREVSTLNFNHYDNWVDVTRRVRFKTDVGMGNIERTARVRNINFPHFGSIMFAEDMATYECLHTFDLHVRTGKFMLADGIVRISKDE